jgi:hypothetical protein
MLFGRDGRGLYVGGVTPARGMEGANAGRDAIQAILEGRSLEPVTIPVFGCRLCLPMDSATHASSPRTASAAH